MAKDKALQELESKFNRLVGTSSTNLCTHCGWCIDACHVYLATRDPETSPVAKAERVRRVYKKNHDWLSKVFPSFTGARPLTEKELDKWVETAYRNCTLCERCVVNCPMAVETSQLLSAARSVLTATGKSPEILMQLADAAIAREENLDMFREFYLEQIRGLEKELQDRMGNSQARIPVEEKARVLYVPLSGAHTILPAALLFNAAKESWTMSMFEASNYAVFLADIPRATQIAERILREAERLGAEEIVVTECGHSYWAMRWELPKWLGRRLTFTVRSIVEVLEEYVRQGRLHLDPSKQTQPLTYHDPCNLGRKGGLFEEPRRLIRALSRDFREMTPNREQAFCCGGGSGLVAILEMQDFRIRAGEVKANQIAATQAKTVATACENCYLQIKDLNERYNLGVRVVGMTELVAEALQA